MECIEIHYRLSRNQSNGSIFTCSQEATKLRKMAVRFAAPSLSQERQLFRPIAIPRKEGSV
jgi:hypothetical protein